MNMQQPHACCVCYKLQFYMFCHDNLHGVGTGSKQMLLFAALTWKTLSEGEEGDEGLATGLREGSLGDDPLV